MMEDASMLMSHETIVHLYQEAQENGDPQEQIKSLAKVNNCSTGEIRKILTDAGEFVPRQKPGPKPKAAVIDKSGKDIEKIIEGTTSALEKSLEETTAEHEEDTEAAGPKTAAATEPIEEVRPEAAGQILPLPDAVKECYIRGLDSMDSEMKRKSEELRNLEEELKILEEKYKTAVRYIQTH